MSTYTLCCRVCLTNNMNLYCVRSDLQNVYQRIANEKYNKVGYPVQMCYICLTVLRKCQRFIETTQDTNIVLKRWYIYQKEIKEARPLYTYSISKVEFVSVDNEATSALENDIKVEIVPPKSEQEAPDNPECNTDVNIENSDIDEQEDYSELAEDPNDGTSTDNDEDNNDIKHSDLDEQTDNSELTKDPNEVTAADDDEDSNDIKIDPIIKNKNKINFEKLTAYNGLASNLDDHANIKTIVKVARTYYNDAPPVKKRKIDETKPQHQSRDASKETAANRLPAKDSVFSCVRSLNTHKATEHKTGVTKEYSCDVCGYKTAKKHYLSRHVKFHTAEKQFTCRICDRKFKLKCNLDRHMKIHTGDKQFSCDICAYMCRQKVHLESHMRTHTGHKPFVCGICGYKCAQKGNLVIHNMKTHTGEKTICKKTHSGEKPLCKKTQTGAKPFKCSICDYKCAQNGNLVIHMRTHTGEKPFSCDVCNHKFKDKSTLTKHIRTHTGNNPYSCDICDYKCKQKGNLNIHKLRVHSGKKPFSCDICNFKFKEKTTLKLHIKIHTGEKPFKCEVCDYRCIQKSSLTTHMKTHTGEKPFLCHICSHRFIRKCDLKSHIKTHMSEKPFACKLCEYKCIRKDRLEKHVKSTHSGGKPVSVSRTFL